MNKTLCVSDEPAFPPTEPHREPLVSLKPGLAERSLEAVLYGDGDSVMLSDPQPCLAVAGAESRAPVREEEEAEVEEMVEEEQQLAMGPISLSKTPIMRMKSKAEPKRIAVSLKSREEALAASATADVFGTGLGGGGGGGGEGEEGGGGEQEQPIEAPLGPMTPVEMLLQDSMRYGGGSLLVNMPGVELQHRKKSSAHGSSVLPAGLAQVRRSYHSNITILVHIHGRPLTHLSVHIQTRLLVHIQTHIYQFTCKHTVTSSH